MALKPQPTTAPDTIRYTVAQKDVTGLIVLGVPVSDLSEELSINGELQYIPVSNTEMWMDDGTPGIYYAKIWGKFVDMRRTHDFLNDKTLTPLSRLLKVATVSFETDSQALTLSQALAAIDDLPEIAGAINGVSALTAIAPV